MGTVKFGAAALKTGDFQPLIIIKQGEMEVEFRANGTFKNQDDCENFVGEVAAIVTGQRGMKNWQHFPGGKEI